MTFKIHRIEANCLSTKTLIDKSQCDTGRQNLEDKIKHVDKTILI